jgi:transcriptional regulator with XRE-family HTH domain
MSVRKGETMGKRIRRLRDAAQMTQEEVCQRGKIPIGSLRKWELDKRIPRFDHAVKLARALGCSLDELAGAEEPAAKKKGGRG